MRLNGKSEIKKTPEKCLILTFSLPFSMNL